MKLNKEKLDKMVEDIKNQSFKEDGFYGITEEDLRTALTPFCMEMTDEEIIKEGEERSFLFDEPTFYEIGFKQGAKLVRDGK